MIGGIAQVKRPQRGDQVDGGKELGLVTVERADRNGEILWVRDSAGVEHMLFRSPLTRWAVFS